MSFARPNLVQHYGQGRLGSTQLLLGRQQRSFMGLYGPAIAFDPCDWLSRNTATPWNAAEASATFVTAAAGGFITAASGAFTDPATGGWFDEKDCTCC